MIAKATRVIGLPIYTVAKGKEVDRVEDVIYDPQQNQVKALLIDKGGWFADAKVILIHEATSIGEDAVLIESKDKIRKASEVRDTVATIAKKNANLTQTEVITEDGTDLGKVTDLYFDTSNGNVEEFEVSQGLIKDVQSGKKTFKVSEVVSVGQDVTIVRGDTEDQFNEQAKHKGVQGAVNKGMEKAKGTVQDVREKATSQETKDKIRDAADSAREKMQELGGRARDKAEEIRNSPSTRDAVNRVKEKTHAVKDTVSTKTEEGRMKIDEQRKKDAVGKYLTVNVLSPDDTVLAKRGDLITNDLIGMADQYGIADKVLNNATSEPPRGHTIVNNSRKRERR